ncbi:ribosomal RNA small subunit methyltransferase RsmB [Desulfitobacterium dichloroeliminans LMG P-21439]|uniref:16S rRNA (cytosine(967)-C(5))-methyltransferase n=1 Tax=Desulfitobacterium dichloroeliminans (strain LMG P-21439 / DCA1) TaxID=871963 RepID=L0FAB4_DESDL|nr:16S rRNA (cytosine(967)-C(5))-methyltransferase RsmB [Desulfitobacterium dichloroeliminans]AGA70152.1 ribosomal RNA small subunit methyltransferase RsmB [Desulfitobacterium dichloroeliminans LMG P-21439]
MNKLTARALAVRILKRIEEENAYANLLLQKALHDLADPRDRQLTTLLVNGSLKNRLTLDYALRRHLRKPLSQLPHEVRWILRVSTFQILYLSRIPASAAINEGVELTKRRQGKYTSLVNSVLRRVLESGWDMEWPSKEREPSRYLSLRYSHPEWMVKRWLKRYGMEETEALCQANNEPAPTWIRTNTLKITRDELVERLTNEGVQVTWGERVPESLLIEDFGSIERLPSFQEGLFTVQDESSQLIAHVLNPQRGQRVLDVCAAPGGKTTHLAQRMENEGEIQAFDLHPHKVKIIEELAQRLGITIIHAQAGDARELQGIGNSTCHKVLVDAPCSGLGVIRRRADMRWHKTEEEIKSLPELQLALLERAAQCVALGGELVYSTCTIEPEENFEVIKAFRAQHPEFATVDLVEGLPYSLDSEQDRKQATKGFLQILPHKHGMDGFFLAKFRRVEV